MNSRHLDNIIRAKLKESFDVKRLYEATSLNWPAMKRIFVALGQQPFYLSGRSGYKIDDPEKGIIHFYNDGEAYIESGDVTTTWNYSNTGGKEKLSVDGHAINISAAIKKHTYQKQQQDRREKEKQRALTGQEAPQQFIDVLQTAFDWLGFIPGYGDIIDVINGLIYIYRGKYFEGVLSFIAVIPLAGSVISKSIKGATASAGGTKVAKQMWDKVVETGNTQDLISFYKQAIERGQLSKLQLKQMSKYGDYIAELLLSGKKKMQNNPTFSSIVTAGNERELYKTINELTNFIKTKISKPARDAAAETIEKAGKRSYADLFAKISGTVLSAGTINAATNFLRKTFGFKGSSQMKLLKDAMDARFIKRVANEPLLLTSMYRLNKLDAEQLAVYGFPAAFNRWGSKLQTQWFQKLKEADPKKWKELSTVVAKNSANDNNIYYMKFINNQFQQASNAFRPNAQFSAGAGDIFGKIFKFDSYRLSNPKNLDIVYNEFNDLAEKLKYDKKDDPNGVIIPAIYSVFRGYLGSTKQQIDQFITPGSSQKPEQRGPVDDTGKIPGGSVVNQPSQDPISAGQDKLKLDFKDMSGRTTDRLQQLEDKGYSPEQILDLKRELGIE